jgi:hypothetical protein
LKILFSQGEKFDANESNEINFHDDIHSEGPRECMKSELVCSQFPTQTSIGSGKYVEYRPLSTLSDGATIEFDISSSGDDYIDLPTAFYVPKLELCDLT